MKRYSVLSLLLSAVWFLLASPAGCLDGEDVVLPTPLARQANLARSHLAKALGVRPEQIQITDVREKVWPNDCLGLPSERPCQEGETKGLEVVLRALGKEFEYRTGGTGSLRFVGPGSAPELLEPVRVARQELSAYLKLPMDRIEVTGVEEAVWPNTCLGLPAPELCAPGETTGYRITFRALGKEYRYHSDRAETIRFAGPGDVPSRDQRE